MSGLKDAPCKDCTKRYPACHDSCEKFLAVKRAYEAQKKKVYEEKTMNYMESVRSAAKSRYCERMKKR